MAITATLSRTWIKRQCIITAVAFVVGLWFFYDGAITYPHSNERYHAYMQFVTSGNEAGWPDYAKQHHWSETPPEKEYRIADQWVLGSAAILGSLAALALLGVSWGREVRSDDEFIYGSDGSRIPISTIQSTDRRKWQSKGIAYAHYELDGRRGRLTLDDFKYAGAEKILEQVEAHIASRTAVVEE